jgi:hypothetical protein
MSPQEVPVTMDQLEGIPIKFKYNATDVQSIELCLRPAPSDINERLASLTVTLVSSGANANNISYLEDVAEILVSIISETLAELGIFAEDLSGADMSYII